MASLPSTARAPAATQAQATPAAPAPVPALAPVGLLPIPSRQEAVVPPQAGLPIASRQAQQLPAAVGPTLLLSSKPCYVVDTITTPVRKGRRCSTRRAARPPVPQQGPGPAAEGIAHALPRWAQVSPSPTGCDPSPVESNVSSLNSSQLQALELESTTSFGYMPGVFAQSWHRKLSDTYNIVNCVGEGRSGAVFIVQHKRTHREYACKFLRKVDHDPEFLRREIDTLRRLDHPNIVRLFEVNEDKDTVFLLMELCHGGDLYEKIYDEGHLDEATAKVLAHQMLSALSYCHASGVAHRDVKPENFLLEKADEEYPVLKLADFGIATSIRPAHISGCVGAPRVPGCSWPSCCDGDLPGSLPYMAPEILSHQWKSLVKGPGGAVDVLAKSDLWSLGVSLYVMLSGMIPFGGEPEEIVRGHPPDFDGAAWADVSKEAKDLVLKLLNPNVKERWTAQQALGHEWFREESPFDRLGLDGLSPAAPLGYGDFAGAFLRTLRVWRGMPKLRRIVITAIARKLEEQHDAHRVAQAAHALLGDASERLSCDRVVQFLSLALAETPAARAMPRASNLDPGAPGTPLVPGAVPSPASCRGSLAASSPGSAPARLQGGTRTGLHVRRRVWLLARSLSGLAEETPTPTPGSASTPSDRLLDVSRVQSHASVGDLTSRNELRYLVEALDGQKDGYVDYTILLASLLPPEVYSNEERIHEVFEVLDLQRRGSIGPKDILAVLADGNRSKHWRTKCKEVRTRELSEMLAEFDFDGDGRLNFAEFSAMVRGPPSDDVVGARPELLASI